MASMWDRVQEWSWLLCKTVLLLNAPSETELGQLFSQKVCLKCWLCRLGFEPLLRLTVARPLRFPVGLCVPGAPASCFLVRQLPFATVATKAQSL
jgi:hypothetical protein